MPYSGRARIRLGGAGQLARPSKTRNAQPMNNPLTHALDASFDAMAPELLAIYKDLHGHPELSMQ